MTEALAEEFQKACNAEIAHHINKLKHELLNNSGFIVVPTLALTAVIDYLKSLQGKVFYDTRPCNPGNVAVAYTKSSRNADLKQLLDRAVMDHRSAPILVVPW